MEHHNGLKFRFYGDWITEILGFCQEDSRVLILCVSAGYAGQWLASFGMCMT